MRTYRPTNRHASQAARGGPAIVVPGPHFQPFRLLLGPSLDSSTLNSAPFSASPLGYPPPRSARSPRLRMVRGIPSP